MRWFALRNYNKASVDDLLRGARLISILIDGREFGSWELRMGPGCDGVPFAQVVLLRDVLRPHPARCPAIGFARSVQHNSLAQAQQLRQDYEVPLLPVASQVGSYSHHTNALSHTEYDAQSACK